MPDDERNHDDRPSDPDTTVPFSAAHRPRAGVRDERPDPEAAGPFTIPRRCVLCGARYSDGRRVCDRDGSVLDDDVDAAVGSTLDGRYRLENVLGRGGMGVVFRARDVELERTVAIKLLDDRYASEPVALRRFVREGKIAREFVHPAVVGIHDIVCRDTGAVYLVLEYIDGRTLGTVLRERGQFAPAEAVAVARPIADALDAAHAKGIVHRDLKPENIMLRSAQAEPRAKLLDLGIAIVHATADQGADTRLTRQGHWIGTPLYMAPEQWNAANSDEGLDGRADVYALGVVVHQLVAGATPFSGNIDALRTQHLEARPNRLDAAVAGVPRAFAEAVSRAMAKDRKSRYATAGEFLDALERSLAGVETAVPAPAAADTAPTLDEAAVVGPSTIDLVVVSTGEVDRIPGNLPAQATSFIAQDGAVDDIVAAFGRARSVTLTGPGGIGKTRLSLEAASRLEDRFPDGTWFVELAAIADAALVTQAVANALGARERPGEPLATSIHERIGDGRLLVVLDNCEHVVDAAADLAARLLRACPRASVLATSRESLAIPGELVIAVAPLAVPSSTVRDDELLHSPAIHLFMDRARAAAPAFAPAPSDLATIAAICRRLDGLPLAIELAAARVRALGLGEVLSRLDDRFRLLAVSERGRSSRQRTLYAAIDWSFQMLTEAERAVLGRLAVFASGATLDAIELVCADSGDDAVVRRESVADLVDGLVAKSLIVADLEREPVRYRMFESIRAFALESLAAAGEREAMESRVDDWVIAMARVCGAARATPAQPVEEKRIRAELDTIRQSLERLSRRDDGGDGLAAAAAWLGPFFENYGLLTEGRAWLDAAVAAGTSQPDRGLALFWSGVLAIDQGDHNAAEARLESALDDARESGDQLAMARVLRVLAFLSMRRNEEARAVGLASESAAVYRQLGDQTGEVAATRIVALVAIGRGEYADARPMLERCEAFHRQRRDERSLAIACYSLGIVYGGLGEFEAAEHYANEAVSIAERLADEQTLAYAAHTVGWVAAERGDASAAIAGFRRSLELAQSVGAGTASVYAIEGIAGALAMEGRAEAAIALSSAAAAHRQGTDQPLTDLERQALDRKLEPAREALTAELRAAAEARGARMEYEAMVDAALRGGG